MRNYTALNEDGWYKALNSEEKLKQAKVAGATSQKDKYKQAEIEKWLIEEGHYTHGELNALTQPLKKALF